MLDDQVAPQRRKAALVRLRKYAGSEPGTTPFAVLAEQAIRARMSNSALAWPAKLAVERGLADTASFIDGIPKLFDKFQLTGYEEPCARLKTQIAAYDDFVRQEVLPKARTDFRQPAELYTFNLKQFGVDMPPAELATIAHAAFDQIQKDMQSLAPAVAKEKGLASTDYRDVIRELKRDQLVGDAILPHYQGAAEGHRSHHQPREARLAADASSADPPRIRSRDGGDAGAEHAAAAPGRQHR